MMVTNSSPTTIVLLGSTGSIGTQACDVIARHEQMFRIVALAAGGTHIDVLAEQIRRFHVATVAVAREEALPLLREALQARDVDVASMTLLAGMQGVLEVASIGADVVLNGITGSVGLEPSIAALQANSQLALANKESVVAGGHLLFDAQVRESQINPVDSEHSAIWQSLRAGTHDEIARLIITASGGPFRGASRDDLAHVTPEQALNHPTWNMGPVVTVNSSTLMNKGLEVIEASRLFSVPARNIAVTVHPQSIVHSMVEFVDGATILQASMPDMRLPIALGISAPIRLPNIGVPYDWTVRSQWEFEPLDNDVFPAVQLARETLEAGEKYTTVLNAANEQAVQAFLRSQLPYIAIIDIVRRTLDVMERQFGSPCYENVEEMHAIEAQARVVADDCIRQFQ